MQTIIVIIIIAVAVAFLVRHYLKHGPCSGCGYDCTSCGDKKDPCAGKHAGSKKKPQDR